MMLRARRLLLVFSGLAQLALLCVLGRLAWIAIADHDVAQARQDRLHAATEVDLARRGALLDRHGRLLADSVEQVRVSSYTRDITHDGARPRSPEAVRRSVTDLAYALEPVLGQPAAALAPRLVRTTDSGGPRFSYVGGPVTDPSAIDALVAGQDRELRRLGMEFGWQRRYPQGACAGNLVGVVDHEGNGAFGLEVGLQKLLTSGLDGRYPHQHLGSFRVATADSRPLPSLSGFDVELTVDSVIQSILAEELGAAAERLHAVGGSAVMIEVDSGDVLGMVSVPTADPEDGRTWTDAAQLFRPVQSVYEPGSTFKPVMLATALDLGLVTPQSRVDCSPERGVFGRRRVKDTHPIHGEATLEEIIVKSSNVGMSNILTRLVPEGRDAEFERMRPVYDVLCRLGVPDRTGVPFPAEARGLVTPLEKWRRNWTLVSVSFGHEVAVTPLQMASIAASLADGWWRRPRLVAAVSDETGRREVLPYDEPVRIWSQASADTVRGYMQAVIDEGGAKEAAVPGVPVAGKTGTTVDEKDPSKETHSFIALAPANAPRIALVVVLEQPKGFRYAAQTVAPATGAILRRALPYLGFGSLPEAGATVARTVAGDARTPR